MPHNGASYEYSTPLYKKITFATGARGKIDTCSPEWYSMDPVSSGKKTARAFRQALPVLLGVLLLISLLLTAVPQEQIAALFTGNILTDSVIGSLIGSVAAGNPLTSYIIGGELLKAGIGLSAVGAFLVAWVTVGLIQLPAEISILGRRFALVRNLLAFISAMAIGSLLSLIHLFFGVMP